MTYLGSKLDGNSSCKLAEFLQKLVRNPSKRNLRERTRTCDQLHPLTDVVSPEVWIYGLDDAVGA
jgi:hypothetical protein